MTQLEADFREFHVPDMACEDAYAAAFDCVYMAECAVLADEDMYDEYETENCSAETSAVDSACPSS